MQTHELLAELRRHVAAGTVSLLDVEKVVKEALLESSRENSVKTFSIGALLLYAIGGLVLLTGVLFLVGQVWDDVGSSGRILLSLGLGLITLASGAYLFLQEAAHNHTDATFAQKSVVPTALFIAGVLLTTPGVFVFLNEQHSTVESVWVLVAVFGMLAAMYACMRYSMQHAVLTTAAIFHATAFFFAFVAALTDHLADTSTVYELLLICTGVAYLALARYVGMHERPSLFAMRDSLLAQPLLTLGTLCVLGASFALMTSYTYLEVLYPLSVLALYYLGVVWESRTMLILGALFFLGYVSYITASYFADSIGWPVALILLGVIFLGLGYATLQMTKKFEK